MKTTRARTLAIAIAGSLLVTTQCIALCMGPGQRLGDPNYTPRHETPAPTYTDAATPMPIAPEPTPVPERSRVAVPTYSASSSNTGPGGNTVGSGTMSAGIGAGGAMVAASARAGTDRASYCRRSGRSQTMIDACLKLAASR